MFSKNELLIIKQGLDHSFDIIDEKLSRRGYLNDYVKGVMLEMINVIEKVKMLIDEI